MVKWFHTYCFMKQLCGTKECDIYVEDTKPKCCGNCNNFSTKMWGDEEDYKCKIHEFPEYTEVFPCGMFCKDWVIKELKTNG